MRYLKNIQGFTSNPEFVPLPLDYYNQMINDAQQRYDVTSQNIAKGTEAVAGTETYDTNIKDMVLNKFTGDISDITSKYNGDLAKASNEIVNRIATERSNPFYNLSKQQLEEAKMYDEVVARLGNSGVQFKDPRKVSLGTIDATTGQIKWVKPDELKYDVQQREDFQKYLEPIQRNIEADISNISPTPIKGGLMEYGTLKEISDTKIRNLIGLDKNGKLKDTTFIDQVISDNPVMTREYKEIIRTNPDLPIDEVRQYFADKTYSQLKSKVSKQVEKRYIEQPGYSEYLKGLNKSSADAYPSLVLTPGGKYGTKTDLNPFSFNFTTDVTVPFLGKSSKVVNESRGQSYEIKRPHYTVGPDISDNEIKPSREVTTLYNPKVIDAVLGYKVINADADDSYGSDYASNLMGRLVVMGKNGSLPGVAKDASILQEKSPVTGENTWVVYNDHNKKIYLQPVPLEVLKGSTDSGDVDKGTSDENIYLEEMDRKTSKSYFGATDYSNDPIMDNEGNLTITNEEYYNLSNSVLNNPSVPNEVKLTYATLESEWDQIRNKKFKTLQDRQILKQFKSLLDDVEYQNEKPKYITNKTEVTPENTQGTNVYKK